MPGSPYMGPKGVISMYGTKPPRGRETLYLGKPKCRTPYLGNSIRHMWPDITGSGKGYIQARTSVEARSNQCSPRISKLTSKQGEASDIQEHRTSRKQRTSRKHRGHEEVTSDVKRNLWTSRRIGQARHEEPTLLAETINTTDDTKDTFISPIHDSEEPSRHEYQAAHHRPLLDSTHTLALRALQLQPIPTRSQGVWPYNPDTFVPSALGSLASPSDIPVQVHPDTTAASPRSTP